MRSFTLSLVATLIFGAVSSAFPLPQSGNPVGEFGPLAGGTNAANPITDVTNLVMDAAGNILNLRAAPPSRGIAAIITEAQSKLSPLTAQIAYATAQNGTSDALSPIANQMQTIISDAAAEIQNLAGQPIDIVLGAANGAGQTTVADLARLIADLLQNVIGALGCLAKTLGPRIDKLISGILCDLIKTIADLLCNVEILVSDILIHLLPAIRSLIRTILDLNLSSIILALNLS